MLQFNDPIYVLLLIPVLAVGWHLIRRRSPDRMRFASLSTIPAQRVTWRVAVAVLTPFLFLCALALMVLALARPQLLRTSERRRADAIAIEMILDVSGSMARPGVDAGTRDSDRTDVPSRLDVVKQSFAAFVEQRPDDLIGLIAFGGTAVTRAPLTIDHGALLHLLAGIEVPGRSPGMAVVSKDELLTAIGDALAVGCARLREADVKSKIMILLTDGGSNAGSVDPKTAVQVARRLGIRVYTIGVGAGQDATTPDGEIAADVALLQAIAVTTGGLCFDAGSPAELTGVLAAIDELEKTSVETFLVTRHRELFDVILIPALGLALAAVTSSILIRRRVI